MTFEFVDVKHTGRVTVVTLNRPAVMNALHKPAHFELHEVFNEFAADPDQWVAIVTGAGDRAFCAGNDLKWQAAGGERGWNSQRLRRADDAFRLRQADHRRGQRRGDGRRVRDGAGL